MRDLAPFSAANYELLDEWLGRRHQGITDIVELEGFLTAIVIGPNTLNPTTWLPKVWGGKNPKFKSLAELNQFIGLVMGYYNDLVSWFEQDPERFEPTFYERKVGGRRIRIVDEWCWGFMKGVRLDTNGWKPIKKQHPDLLKPLELFGTSAGFRELDAGDPEKMHRKWSPKIAPAVRGIHQYWLPHRLAQYRAESGQALH